MIRISARNLSPMLKLCSSCGDEFTKYQVHGRVCRPCKNRKQREYRESNQNSCTKVYEKTLDGYLMRTYRNMLSRVTGVLKKKAHLYEGKDILDKDHFYHWSKSSNFPSLLKAYQESGWEPRMAPSIDRKDPELGYVDGNIRWITHSENSSTTRRHYKEQYD